MFTSAHQFCLKEGILLCFILYIIIKCISATTACKDKKAQAEKPECLVFIQVTIPFVAYRSYISRF